MSESFVSKPQPRQPDDPGNIPANLDRRQQQGKPGRKPETIKEMVDEVNRQFQLETSARIKAGQLLLELKRRFDAGEMAPADNWWKWYEKNIKRTRRDGEKVMALARAEDPEAAHEEEKAAARAGMRKSRKNETAANVSRRPKLKPPEPAEDEPEALFLHRAEEAQRLADCPEELAITEELVAVARQAADAWEELADEMEARRKRPVMRKTE